MKKTIKRKTKDMRVYKDSNGVLTIIGVVLDAKNDIVGTGDVQIPVGKSLQELKQQLFSMIKATRLNLIDDQFLEKHSKIRKNKK
jgi:hypothetical protein